MIDNASRLSDRRSVTVEPTGFLFTEIRDDGVAMFFAKVENMLTLDDVFTNDIQSCSDCWVILKKNTPESRVMCERFLFPDYQYSSSEGMPYALAFILTSRAKEISDNIQKEIKLMKSVRWF